MNLMEFLNGRRTFEASGEPAGGGSPPADPPADPPAAPDYSFAPDEFRKDGEFDADGFKLYLDELKTTKSQLDERLAEVPEDPTGYEFALPEDLSYGEDLELPEGFDPNITTDDPDMKPLFGELASLLHQNGIPKSAAPQFMGLLAKYEASKFSRGWQTQKSEMAALGDNADARISRLQRALENKLPADKAQALKAFTTSAAAVKALETLLSPKTLNGTGGEPPKTPERNPLAERYPSLNNS